MDHSGLYIEDPGDCDDTPDGCWGDGWGIGFGSPGGGGGGALFAPGTRNTAGWGGAPYGRFGLMALIIFLAAIDGCGATPRLTPEPVRLTVAEQVAKATVVVVGIACDESRVGPVIDRDGFPISLRKVNVRVESVLAGVAPPGRLDFYYYAPEGAWDGLPFNIIGKEERSVYLLVTDGKVLRAVTDVYPSHIVVSTGRHPGLPSSRSSLRETIAELLVLPGQGLNADSYGRSLHDGVYQAQALVGREESARLLRSVLSNSDIRLRGKACIALAEFLDDKECASILMNDPDALPGDRQKAMRLSHIR